MSTRFSLEAPLPTAAVEIASTHVAAAVVETRGGRPVVAAQAAEALPAGVLAPSLSAQNVINTAAVGDAVGRVLERIGRPRRIGLIVPDQVARVSIVRFEQVPDKVQDLAQLIRWQVRKSAPFPIEEGQVSYLPGRRDAGDPNTPPGHEFIVTLARQAVIRGYEEVCAAAGAQAGLVDIATFNVINLALASAPPSGDWLLVNVAGDAASIALMRGEHLMFFRTRAADADGTLADLVHQTSMYYEDRLRGSGFTHAMISGLSTSEPPGDADRMRRLLEERLGMPVQPLNVFGPVSLTDRIAADPALADTLAAPLGLLVRGGEAAA
jgi:Tfp pilus assembly PilM family ATPase